MLGYGHEKKPLVSRTDEAAWKKEAVRKILTKFEKTCMRDWQRQFREIFNKNRRLYDGMSFELAFDEWCRERIRKLEAWEEALEQHKNEMVTPQPVQQNQKDQLSFF